MWHSQTFNTVFDHDIRETITTWLNAIGAADLVVVPNLNYWTVFAYVEDKVAVKKCPNCGGPMIKGKCPACSEAPKAVMVKAKTPPMVAKVKRPGAPKMPFKK